MGIPEELENTEDFAQSQVPPPVEHSAKSYDTEKVDWKSHVPPPLDDNAVAGPSEPPPDFKPYEPSISIKDSGDVVSHDHHLNEDGEALYRFLLEHAANPPDLLIEISGCHQERRTRVATRVQNGRSVNVTETYNESILDFFFTIDITHYILPEVDPAIWIVGDSDPAYRGSVVRQVDNTLLPTGAGKDLEAGKATLGKGNSRRKATKDEKVVAAARRETKNDSGLPPWVLMAGEPRGTEANLSSEEDRIRFRYATNAHTVIEYDDSTLNPPSKTIREWADEYCASKKLLKEFKFTKQVYGWNFPQIRDSIDRIVRANWRYNNTPNIRFMTNGTEISVRPDNRLSRTLSKTWAYVLLWLFLVYPLVIWPFKRFTRWGGGEWRVAGCAFALTKWDHLGDSSPGETAEGYMERSNVDGAMDSGGSPRSQALKATPRGVSRLVGLREGEWFEQWRETIGFKVRRGHTSGPPEKMPLAPKVTDYAVAGAGLDGWGGI